jgi:parallel beta-helix repeat protein
MWYTSNTNNKIVSNRIANNGQKGMWIDTASNNYIYHNNFVNNPQQIYSANNAINIWDNEYPSGGNYWSNYNGADTKKGSSQDITGSDGIGDTAFVINANNQDHYPLMTLYIPEFASTLTLLFSVLMISFIILVIKKRDPGKQSIKTISI